MAVLDGVLQSLGNLEVQRYGAGPVDRDELRELGPGDGDGAGDHSMSMSFARHKGVTDFCQYKVLTVDGGGSSI